MSHEQCGQKNRMQLMLFNVKVAPIAPKLMASIVSKAADV